MLTAGDKDALPLELFGLPIPHWEVVLAKDDVGQDIIKYNFDLCDFNVFSVFNRMYPEAKN